MGNDNLNNKQSKKKRILEKEGKKILKILELSRANHKAKHIVNIYLMPEIIAVMKKNFDWQEKDEENLERIKRELMIESEWKKIKDFLENLWLKDD